MKDKKRKLENDEETEKETNKKMKVEHVMKKEDGSGDGEDEYNEDAYVEEEEAYEKVGFVWRLFPVQI